MVFVSLDACTKCHSTVFLPVGPYEYIIYVTVGLRWHISRLVLVHVIPGTDICIIYYSNLEIFKSDVGQL